MIPNFEELFKKSEAELNHRHADMRSPSGVRGVGYALLAIALAIANKKEALVASEQFEKLLRKSTDGLDVSQADMRSPSGVRGVGYALLAIAWALHKN